MTRRPVLHGQRRPVDPRNRPRTRLSLRGELLDLSGEEAGASPGQGQEGREGCPSGWPTSRVGAEQRQGPPDEAEGRGWRATRRWPPRPSAPASRTSTRSRSAGTAPRQQGHRGEEPAQGASATGCSSACRSPCRATASSGSSARTVSARRRCSRRLLGLEKADAGAVDVEDTVKISYVDQSRGGLDPNKNLWETVSGGHDYINVGQVEVPSRAYVSQFGFKGPDQQKKAGILSGGERSRLNLALTLRRAATCSSSTSRRTTSTSRRWARWRTHCSTSPDMSSSATTGGSSTGS